MDVTFVDAGSYLEVRCEGAWDPVEVTEVVRRVRATADQVGRDKVLIDWSRVSMPSNPAYRIFAGEDIATILSPPHSVAVLARKPLDKVTTEKVAVSHGAQVLVHHDKAHLLHWLLGVRQPDTAMLGG